MRAQVDGVGLGRWSWCVTWERVFCLGARRPGQAEGFLCGAWSVGFDLGPVVWWPVLVLQLIGPWSSCDDLGTMAAGIAAGIPSAASGPGAAIV